MAQDLGPKVDLILTRLSNIDKKLEQINSCVSNLENKLDKLGIRVKSLEDDRSKTVKCFFITDIVRARFSI